MSTSPRITAAVATDPKPLSGHVLDSLRTIDAPLVDFVAAGGLRGFTPEQMFGQSSRLNLDAEVVPLHDFSQTGAPVTAYRVRIQGEHIAPRLIGERRSTRAEAEADLAKLVHA